MKAIGVGCLFALLVLNLLTLFVPLPVEAAACGAWCGDDFITCTGNGCAAQDGVGCCGSGGFTKCGGYEGDPLKCNAS